MTSLQRLFRFIACASCRARSPTDGAGLISGIVERNRKGIKSAWNNQSRGEMEMYKICSRSLEEETKAELPSLAEV